MDQESKNKKLKPFFKFDPVATVGLLFIVFISSQIVASFLISLYPSIRNWTEAQSLLWIKESIEAQFFYVLFAEILVILMIFWLVKQANITKKQIGIRKPKLSDAGWAVIAYGLYFLCFIVIAVIAHNLIPSINMDQDQKTGFENAYLGYELAMTFIALVILAPLAEEILFRGFLFTSLRAKYSYVVSAVTTSILFGIVHLQFGANAPLLWVAALDTFILSMFLCYLREKSKGVWSPVFLHAIKNCVAFLTLFGARIFF